MSTHSGCQLVIVFEKLESFINGLEERIRITQDHILSKKHIDYPPKTCDVSKRADSNLLFFWLALKGLSVKVNAILWLCFSLCRFLFHIRVFVWRERLSHTEKCWWPSKQPLWFVKKKSFCKTYGDFIPYPSPFFCCFLKQNIFLKTIKMKQTALYQTHLQETACVSAEW